MLIWSLLILFFALTLVIILSGLPRGRKSDNSQSDYSSNYFVGDSSSSEHHGHDSHSSDCAIDSSSDFGGDCGGGDGGGGD